VWRGRSQDVLTLKQEKAALLNAWRSALKSYFQHALDCREVGVCWNRIKTRLTELRQAGRSNFTIEQWATKNPPVSRRWLDQFGKFADEFVAADRPPTIAVTTRPDSGNAPAPLQS
jgi:hypothetical protein